MSSIKNLNSIVAKFNKKINIINEFMQKTYPNYESDFTYFENPNLDFDYIFFYIKPKLVYNYLDNYQFQKILLSEDLFDFRNTHNLKSNFKIHITCEIKSFRITRNGYSFNNKKIIKYLDKYDLTNVVKEINDSNNCYTPLHYQYKIDNLPNEIKNHLIFV